MAILTDSGRAAAAKAVKDQTIHHAWGRGDPDWDDDVLPPPEAPGATALLDEVGRRRATQVGFAIPDENGDIQVPNGRFSLSEDPTKYLYVRIAYDFSDAEGEDIREVAIFLGTVPTAGNETKPYLLPAEVEDPGILFALENIQKLPRAGNIRQQFEFVIQF